jgi:hypothetical protein
MHAAFFCSLQDLPHSQLIRSSQATSRPSQSKQDISLTHSLTHSFIYWLIHDYSLHLPPHHHCITPRITSIHSCRHQLPLLTVPPPPWRKWSKHRRARSKDIDKTIRTYHISSITLITKSKREIWSIWID